MGENRDRKDGHEATREGRVGRWVALPEAGISEKIVDGRKLHHYRRYKQDEEQSVALKL
jgi:hypothetical protein